MLAVKLVKIEDKQKKFFTEGEYVLGRDDACDIPVSDQAVSGRHATLRITDNKVTIQDHDSLNGTYINDPQHKTPIRFETLQDRDVFALGPNRHFGVRVLEVHPGGFWMRSLAYLIDSAVIALGMIVILVLVGLAYLGGRAFSMASAFDLFFVVNPLLGWLVLIILVPLLYTVLMNGARGQTLGKMICGLKIVRPDFSRISYWQALSRYVLQLLGAALSLGIMCIFLAAHAQKRGWHDLIADTRVVYWKDFASHM
jgi:uncharacterized RDD family membrane protein YckC